MIASIESKAKDQQDETLLQILKTFLASTGMPLASCFSEVIFSFGEILTKGRRSNCSVQRLSYRQFVRFNYETCRKELERVFKSYSKADLARIGDELDQIPGTISFETAQKYCIEEELGLEAKSNTIHVVENAEGRGRFRRSGRLNI